MVRHSTARQSAVTDTGRHAVPPRRRGGRHGPGAAESVPEAPPDLESLVPAPRRAQRGQAQRGQAQRGQAQRGRSRVPEPRARSTSRWSFPWSRRDRPQPVHGPPSAPLAPIRDAVLQTVELVKVHGHGPGAVLALDGVTMAVERGQFTSIMGPSGSGKSTLLHCLAGLDSPTSGHVMLGPTDLTRLSERRLTQLRRGRVGFVFQSYDLLPQLTVRQNIVLPVEVAGARVDEGWFDTVLEALDLGSVLRQRPDQLSGGQQQRVAVARAVLGRPDVVLADEPTGALDAGTTREMLGFLRASVDHLGQTIVIVTHDPLAAQHTDRALMLHEGRVAGELLRPTAHGVLDALAALDVAGFERDGPARADPERPDPGRADPDRADPDRADPDRADPDRADPDRAVGRRSSTPGRAASRRAAAAAPRRAARHA